MSLGEEQCRVALVPLPLSGGNDEILMIVVYFAPNPLILLGLKLSL
jgi:hypothetical protein